MSKVNQHLSVATLAIIVSAFALGFFFGLVASRTSTPRVSADIAHNADLLVMSNTLGSKEINVTPTIDSNAVGESHTITATVTTTGAQPVAGVEVDFSIIAGPNTGVSESDVTDADGAASFTYTGEKVGTDTIAACFTDDSGDNACDLAAKHWTKPAPAPIVRLTPSRDTNPVGTQHTVTATVTAKDKREQPVPGILVDFRVITGPTAGVTGSDTTDVNGKADFSYQGAAVGTDTIMACVDAGASGRACDQAIKQWTAPEDAPRDGTSCQGVGSCRGRNISAGENSCNGRNSCSGINLTIGNNSCNEAASCRGNNQTIGNGSCEGGGACRGNSNDIGSESCNGAQACSGNNNSVGDNSCNGEKSCVGNNGNVGDNACNTDKACPGRGNKGNNDDRGGGDRGDNNNNQSGKNQNNNNDRNGGGQESDDDD